MDYEKKYKEALNWMRSIYPTLAGSDKEDAEHYFPELRESEDERIRKWIYTCIEALGYPADEDAEKELEEMQPLALAWLEKQKEQKPNIDLIQKSWYMEGYHDRDNNKEPKWIIKTGEGGPRYEENPKYGKLIEQKSAEWSKNDTVFLNEIIDFFDNGTVRLQHDLTMYAHWLKSLPERFNLQLKPEWNEEDEEDLRTRFAFYTYKDEDDVLYLSNVFVEETSRNHGFGTKILAAAEKVAETIGATSIRLKVKRDNPAHAWYQKHGYNYITFEDEYDWFEKTPGYSKSVKQEWSEEDKK